MLAKKGVLDKLSSSFSVIVGLTYLGVSQHSFPLSPTVPPSTCITVIADMLVSVAGNGCSVWCCVDLMSRFYSSIGGCCTAIVVDSRMFLFSSESFW